MGCYYATDVVTRVPIRAGEDTVVVVLSETRRGNLIQDTPHLTGSLAKIRRGKYDEAGWLCEEPDPRVSPEYVFLAFYLKGETWDAIVQWMKNEVATGYPSYHEFDRPLPEPDDFDYWGMLTRRWKTSEDTQTRDLVEELRYINDFCLSNRIALSVDVFAGSQRGVTKGTQLVADLMVDQMHKYMEAQAEDDAASGDCIPS